MMGGQTLPVVKAEHLTTDGTDVAQLLPGLPRAVRYGGAGRGRTGLAGRTLPFPGGGVEQHLLQGGEGEVVGVELLLQGLLPLQGPGGQIQGTLHPSLLPSPSPPVSTLPRLLDFLRVVGVVGNVEAGTTILLEVHLAQQMGLQHVLFITGYHPPSPSASSTSLCCCVSLKYSKNFSWKN